MPKGLLLKGIDGFYYVKSDDKTYECRARGILRKQNIIPMPGDEVFISINKDGRTGSIEEIADRSSCFTRPMVANVNQIIPVIAVKAPSPDFMLLDKLLITAEAKNIHAVICINKTDLDSSSECNKIKQVYDRAGYEVITSSNKSADSLRHLKEVMKYNISVLAGQSGVGKSTILNTLMDASVMETGTVSKKIERGRHTTRHAELIELDTGGYLVDTPGFSSYELSEIKYCDLELYYPEFAQCLGKCRYTGCSHISEPFCAVKQAVEDGLVDEERYKRYIQFYSTLKEIYHNRYKNK
ncbi:ribosome biogenesis GTPase [Anaerobacterium chartisolvens]|uniref:Small ribosomal subunit biogenesis GTPase RsgA n=1 Tax=Anaerobacterium chartisolvens TaxID=1297424 RepID=A0A369B8B1_9FIRM|nr:ribosome small subunit-dependent GTPase A [Anaerobacterium chartisolvens]RCX16786.1 ribosome biogenesis GTPase [Anaerobacterium chartisolvens]